MSHPGDDELLAAAEGTGGAGARDHAAACTTCAARLADFRAAAAALACAAPATRRWCPPREALGDLVDGIARSVGEPLAAWTPAAVQRHLGACPTCREDARDLRALLEAPAAPLTGRVAARVVLAIRRAAADVRAAGAAALDLLETTLAPRPAPALLPVRGGEGQAAPVVVGAPFGGGELEVTLAFARGAVDLRARTTGVAPRSWRLAVSSRRGDAAELLESRSADEHGVVVVAGLEPGRYLLEAFGPQRREPDLAVDVELR